MSGVYDLILIVGASSGWRLVKLDNLIRIGPFLLIAVPRLHCQVGCVDFHVVSVVVALLDNSHVAKLSGLVATWLNGLPIDFIEGFLVRLLVMVGGDALSIAKDFVALKMAKVAVEILGLP